MMPPLNYIFITSSRITILTLLEDIFSMNLLMNFLDHLLGHAFFLSELNTYPYASQYHFIEKRNR